MSEAGSTKSPKRRNRSRRSKKQQATKTNPKNDLSNDQIPLKDDVIAADPCESDNLESSSQNSTPMKKVDMDLASRDDQNEVEQRANSNDKKQTDVVHDIKEEQESADLIKKDATNCSDLLSTDPLHAHDHPKSSNTETTVDNDRRAEKKVQSRDRSTDFKELKERFESQSLKMANLSEHVRLQASKIRELEAMLLNTTKTCNQLEKMLQQETACRGKLEQENTCSNQTVVRLKTQIAMLEKSKLTNDELLRTMNATLMERETEISILKLKLTRLQTNPTSNVALNVSISSVSSAVKNDPSHAFINSGRSNSEFDRNSYIRSNKIADSCADTRSSTSQLRSVDKDATIWASVPPELTPSKRPQLLEKSFQAIYSESKHGNSISSGPIERNRRYRTMPTRSTVKDPSRVEPVTEPKLFGKKDSGEKVSDGSLEKNLEDQIDQGTSSKLACNEKTPHNKQEKTHQDSKADQNITTGDQTTDVIPPHSNPNHVQEVTDQPKINYRDTAAMPPPLTRTPTLPVRLSGGLKKIIDKLRRSDSHASPSSDYVEPVSAPVTPASTPFRRCADRATFVGLPSNVRSHISSNAMNFQTDKPFAEWDTDMIVEWMTKIGLSMYTAQCRRWVRCGAHIMNATPAEVDKGLGIMNHLHRKKLRLAISELNDDCDKITKAASRLDYLWVSRWLEDIGLPQYKEAFINARVDGRVLNYLTIEDLVSLGVKSILHHASIRCGIKVLRTINFDLQLLRRRATADEIEEMNNMRQQVGEASGVPPTPIKCGLGASDPTSRTNGNINLQHWTCHRVMEWLRLIDFAEFAPNMRGSGVHGGLIVFEDGFNVDTMCSLLSIPQSRTLLRRHLSTYFETLIGQELCRKKRQHRELSTVSPLNPMDEIKTPKKKPWFGRLKGSKVGQDGMDDYLCPMYPVDPQILRSTPNRKNDVYNSKDGPHLAKIPESIKVS